MKKVISFDKEILFPTMIGEITAISLDHTLKFLSKNDVEGDFVVSGRYKMTEASAIEEDFKYTLPIEITMAETFTLDTAKIDIKDFNYEVIDEEILKVKIDIQVEGVEEVVLDDEKVEEESVVEELEETKEAENVSLVQEELREVEVMIEELPKEPEVIESSILEEEVRECDGEEKCSYEKLTDVEPVLVNDSSKIEEEEKEDILKETEVEPMIQKEEVLVEETKNVVNNKEEVTNNIQSIFRVFNDAEETYKTYTVYIMRKNDSINTVLDRYQITKEQLEEYNDLSKIELGSKVIIPTTND